MPLISRELMLRRFLLASLFWAVLVVLAAGLAILHVRQSTQDDFSVELEAVANFKQGQLDSFFEERYADAQVVAGSDLVFQAYAQWLRNGDQQAFAALRSTLETTRRAYRYLNVRLVDAQGKTLLSARDTAKGSGAALLQPLIERALREQQVVLSDFYLAESDTNRQVHLDFIAPAKSRPGRPALALVFEIDLERSLFSGFEKFPFATNSGEVLLFQKQGENVRYLDRLNFSNDASMVQRPMQDEQLLSAQVLRDPANIDRLLSGVSYRGVPQFGVARPLRHLPWFLIAKIDRDEVYATGLHDVYSIMLVALLALAGIPLVRFFLRQSHALLAERFRNDQQTEQLSTLRQIAESERRFQDIAAASEDWVWEVDARLFFRYSSVGARKVIGYAPEELAGKSLVELLHNDGGRRGVGAFGELALRNEALVDYEHDAFERNGNLKHLRSTAVPVFGEEGALLGYRGVSRDITLRKRAEDELLKMSRAVEQTPSGIVITDIARRIEYVNQAFKTIYGYSANEVIGVEIGQLLRSGETGNEVYQSLYAALAVGAVWKGEFINRRRDGRQITVATIIAPIRHTDGEITHYISIQEDITEQKKIAQELERYRAQLAQLVDERTSELEAARQEAQKALYLLKESVNCISSAFLIFDPDDKLLVFNEAYLQLFGECLRDQVEIGASFTDLVGAVTEAGWRWEQDGDAMSSQAHWVEAHRDAPGMPRVVSLNDSRWVQIIDFKMAGGYTVGSRIDITEQIQTQHMLEAARDEANTANRAKSLFLANMSHEIRTPMNAIIGLSHLCLQTALDGKQRDYVTKVHHSATLLLGILNDILDFSKIEAGKLSIEQVPFCLSELLSNVTFLFAGQMCEKNLVFNVRVAPGVPDRYLGDPLRITQVMTNLLSNAVKFTAQGSIEVAVQLIERRGATVELRFAVSDSGIGIGPAARERLFHTFTQADASTTRKYGGTGLGLTISKQLVEMMGGKISVDSVPGQGSVFAFSLPLGELPEESTLARAADYRILVVDDEPINRALLRKMLGDIGVEVDVAETGEAGVACVAKAVGGRPFDVILMDWRLPGIDGFEAIRRIRQEPGYADVPAIMITAADMQEIESMLSHGVDRFLFKPIRRSTLLSVLGEVLHGQGRRRRPTVAKPFSGRRILLVEDNELNRQVARELLENDGATVVVADHGRQALTLLERGAYDLVLMDMQMPVMDGVTAAVEIRRIERFAALPIVAMTANVLAQERERCLNAGMNDFISKPVLPETLREVLSRHLAPLPLPLAAPVPALATPIAAVAGEVIDRALGLRYANGKPAAYERLLGVFRQSTGDAPDKLAEALAAGDREVAQRTMHSVRGMAGTIGALGLAGLAGEVEEFFKENAQGSPPEVLLERFAREMAAVVESIDTGVPAE